MRLIVAAFCVATCASMASAQTLSGKKQPACSQHSIDRTVVIGLAVAGPSLVQLKVSDPQMAQATPPLQQTPTPTPQNSPPAESKPGGDRPTTPAPEPARPDVEVQKSGATPALPPAPAEKTAPPIQRK
jgi:hypothetical protein